MESYRRGINESDDSGKRETMQYEDPHDEVVIATMFDL